MATLDEMLQSALDQGGKSVLFEPGKRPRVRASDHLFDLDAPVVDDHMVRQICREAFQVPIDVVALGYMREPRTYQSPSGSCFTVTTFDVGSHTGVSFKLGSAVAPSLPPLPARRPALAEGTTYCRWCGMDSDTPDRCSWCHRDTRRPPSIYGQPFGGPDRHPDDRPGDAPVPAMLSGLVPPRAGRDAKPLPKDVLDIEPPREP